MTAMFGEQWTAKFGDRVTFDGPTDYGTVWRTGLAGLSSTQIRAGFRCIVNAGLHHAPNLSEFVALCRGAASDAPAGAPHAGAYRHFPKPEPWSGPTEAGKQGLRDALAVLRLRSQAETEMGGEPA